MDGHRRRWRVAAAVRLTALCVVGVSLGACGSAAAPPDASPVTTGAGVVVASGGTAVPAAPSAAAPAPSGAAPATSAAASVDVPADLAIRRKTWGGLCPGGPCGSSLVITASGSWVVMSEGAVRTGTLPPATVAALTLAARTTHLDAATGTPDCAANHDGKSVAYSWTMDGVTRSASSCDHPIDRGDPLTVEIEKVARGLNA